MKRVSVVVVALLASAFIMSSLVEIGVGNSEGLFVLRPIRVISPQPNRTYYSLSVNFTASTPAPAKYITQQSGWYFSSYSHVQCFLDGNLLNDPSLKEIPFSISLENLGIGRHVVRVVADLTIHPTTDSKSTWYALNVCGWEGEHPVESGYITFFVSDFFISPILSPQPRTHDSSDVNLEFMAGEGASRFEYCLDGEGNVPVSGNTTLSGLSGGNHNVIVYGFDQLRNMCSSETVYFSVDFNVETESFPTTLIVAAVVLVSVVAISLGLLFYFRKRRHPESVWFNDSF
jgi:hypothetical protein